MEVVAWWWVGAGKWRGWGVQPGGWGWDSLMMWRRVEVTVDSVEERLRELFVGGYRRLVSQVYFFCGDLGEAEDAVQEAFVRAVARQRQFARVENRRLGCGLWR